MGMSFVKILTHPDKNTIVRMLTQGMGVRAVAKFLKERYPGDTSKHISTVTLQKFRKEKLNLEKEALTIIKKEVKDKKELKELKKEDTKIKQLPAYKEKLKEVIDYHVDIQNELKEMLVLVKARIEDLFDRAAAGEITINEEGNLLKYFQIVTVTLERWAKYVEKIADRTIETTNVNITVIEDQMAVLREAVMEIIIEMDPDLRLKFLDKLNNKITTLSYRKGKEVSFNQIRNDVKHLSATVEEIENNDS